MKYRLTEETSQFYGRILHRIECVTAFAHVKVGDKGGWVESEANLSQYGSKAVGLTIMLTGMAVFVTIFAAETSGGNGNSNEEN